MGQHTSKQTVEYFLEPLRDDQIEIIFEHAQPEVVNNTDKDIYRSVMNNYRNVLGTFEKPNDQKYKRTFEVNGDNTTLTESSEIFFTNGILQWNVEWKNDKLAVMNAAVPNMAKTLPTYNIDAFVQRGIKFIRHFYAVEATEFAEMMSPALAKVVPPPEVRRMLDLEIDRAELGEFKDVKPRDIPDLTTIPATTTGKTFDITYEIIREKAIGLGTVTFTIDKFESSLMGFSFCQQLLRSLIHPEPTEGAIRTKKALQHMINLEAEEYYTDCIKSLRNLIHPEIIQCYWEDVFTYLGPLEETIDEAMERCEFEVTTDDSLLPKLITHGTLKFLNNVFIYDFAWVNSAMLSFNYRFEKEVVGFSRSPIIVPAQAYWEKTKKWFLDVIRYDKREILAAEMLPGFSDEPNTVTQYNVMKTLMNENWNFKNLDIVEFEVTSPVPMPANFPTPIQQQFTYKFIIRDNAHHEFESQVKWLVGQFRSFISSFYINRINANPDHQSLEFKEVAKLANILFSKVTVDISSVRNSFEDADQYRLVLSHSRQDIRQVSSQFRLSGDSLLTDISLAFDVLNWNLIDSITLDVTKVVSGTPVIMGTLILPLKDIITAKIDANTIAFEKDYTTEGQNALPVKIRFEFAMND
jgi:hypothetical protein